MIVFTVLWIDKFSTIVELSSVLSSKAIASSEKLESDVCDWLKIKTSSSSLPSIYLDLLNYSLLLTSILRLITIIQVDIS